MTKKSSNNWILNLFIIFTAFLLVACNTSKGSTEDTARSAEKEGKETTETEDNSEAEPVTLTFNYGWEEEFIEDIKGPVEEKFPNITLEFAEFDYDKAEEEISKGNIPDIFYLSGGDKVDVLKEYELAYNLDELIERNNFDLESISKEQIDRVRTWGDGDLYYFPYVKRWDVLYYNKGIFDLFGVNYPKDGMTWDEITDLAREVTGEKNGTEYRGIDISASGPMLKQLGVNHIDPETNEPMYLKDGNFAKYLNQIEKIASIQGVIPDNDEDDWGAFINKQNVAMVPLFDIHIWLNGVEAETGLAWDMVSYPEWEDHPNTGPNANAGGLSISNTSEHKEAAFQVLEYLMSEEWQMMRSKKGFATVLDNKEIQEAFCSEVEGLEEKNMQAVFKLKAVDKPVKVSPYEEKGEEVFDAMKFIKEGKDVNTYLRETYDEVNALVKEAAGSK
ncbi:extracellular solute-binding protein [Lederbergia sp. NSJ-179]|uniref:ABC transporter substrate-binding protein n=1 Tax=Lederbergia sp. NSJ-179 TaxID=2931402 RepID=UPI001FD45C1B|nr:extracellular solute-binding protein [Lederbergia sp. NSJ-179]MCJ7840799.1 extracellular solute-binding protein [Lederbergia sp. NSJ-179]